MTIRRQLNSYADLLSTGWEGGYKNSGKTKRTTFFAKKAGSGPSIHCTGSDFFRG